MRILVTQEWLRQTDQNRTRDKSSGTWVPGRPIRMDSLLSRLRDAWLVFCGKADAIVWDKELMG